MISILLVDDEPPHLILAKRGLEKAFPAIQILEADSIDTAKTKMAEAPSTLTMAIVDYNLDNESGADLLAYIRSTDETSELICIVVSTSERLDDAVQCYQAGAHCYVVKASEPLTYQKDLVSAVSYFLKVTSAS